MNIIIGILAGLFYIYIKTYISKKLVINRSNFSLYEKIMFSIGIFL